MARAQAAKKGNLSILSKRIVEGSEKIEFVYAVYTQLAVTRASHGAFLTKVELFTTKRNEFMLE